MSAPVEHVLARLLGARARLPLVLVGRLEAPVDLPVLRAQHRRLLLEELVRLRRRLQNQIYNLC